VYFHASSINSSADFFFLPGLRAFPIFFIAPLPFFVVSFLDIFHQPFKGLNSLKQNDVGLPIHDLTAQRRRKLLCRFAFAVAIERRAQGLAGIGLLHARHFFGRAFDLKLF